MTKKLGFLGTCPTPYCGGVEGFFCVRCSRYVADCRCTPSECSCADSRYWASTRERSVMREALRRDGMAQLAESA